MCVCVCGGGRERVKCKYMYVCVCKFGGGGLIVIKIDSLVEYRKSNIKIDNIISSKLERLIVNSI